MIDILKKEIENLSHTLNDVRASIECSKILIEGHNALLTRLEPRVESYQTRIDFLTIEMGKLSEVKKNES